MMKTPIRSMLVCGALLSLNVCGNLAAAEKSAAPGAPMTRKEAVLVTLMAAVESVDLEKRELTLKGPLGNTETFVVDQKVKRLGEVKPGDFVRADYYISVAAEVRKPTPEEEKTPLVVLDAAGKAPAGSSPAAGGLRRFKVVATIEGLDRTTETVTVKGPRGKFLTVRVLDPMRLTQVRIGDTVVITYTEALAISVEKAEKKSAE